MTVFHQHNDDEGPSAIWMKQIIESGSFLKYLYQNYDKIWLAD